MPSSPSSTLNSSSSHSSQSYRYCEIGRAVIAIELQAINQLLERINHEFAHACTLIYHCHSRVVVIGMGKSGHIGNKIAATLASTGTPAFFVHPGEACHGDIGMITQQDVVLALSNSGETDELITLLPVIKALQIPLIRMTGNPHSTLAKASTVNLDISVTKEACPLGLAPTSSTTVALVMGDALAITLLQIRELTKEDFARYHPGGSLGQRLLLKAENVMYRDLQIPKVSANTTLDEVLVEMTQKSLGMTTITDDNNHLLGIYTDGDLRRTLNQHCDVKKTMIHSVMTSNPKTISPDTLAIQALKTMENFKITSLVVVNKANQVLGVVHLHSLLQRGLSTLGVET